MPRQGMPRLALPRLPLPIACPGARGTSLRCNGPLSRSVPGPLLPSPRPHIAHQLAEPRRTSVVGSHSRRSCAAPAAATCRGEQGECAQGRDDRESAAGYRHLPWVRQFGGETDPCFSAMTAFLPERSVLAVMAGHRCGGAGEGGAQVFRARPISRSSALRKECHPGGPCRWASPNPEPGRSGGRCSGALHDETLHAQARRAQGGGSLGDFGCWLGVVA